MREPMKVAALQLRCTPDREANLRRAFELVDAAVSAGAGLVMTPENTDAIAPAAERLAMAEPLDGPYLGRWRDKARACGAWILVGSLGEKVPGEARVHNTSALLSPEGRVVAAYRKLHLFDADPPDGVAYRESAHVKPGAEVVVAETPCGGLGMSICYDLRFAELYRAFASRGASVVSVPAAFTVPTGRAHWETLLRARAIENLAYVVAPAQVGEHFPGRRSYGHALIVGPWGDVLADAGEDGDGFVTATIDPAEVARVRRMLPALEHRRL
jgi:predicted amidohydrolase